MILGLQIGMFIAGLIALIRGKVHLSRRWVVSGAPARVAGFFLLLPLPLAFALGFTLGFVRAAQGERPWMRVVEHNLLFIELGLSLVCAAVALILCLSSGKAKEDEEEHEAEGRRPEDAAPRPAAAADETLEAILLDEEEADAPFATLASRPPSRAADRGPRKTAGPRRRSAAPVIVGCVLVGAGLLLIGGLHFGEYLLNESLKPRDRQRQAQRPPTPPPAVDRTPPRPSQPPVPKIESPPPPPPTPPPPPDPVILPPPRATFALRPTPFTGDKRVVHLPGTVKDLAVGGGGRFVVLQFEGSPRLAVFDVNTGTVVKYLPVPNDGVKIAAGMDRLLIAVPSAGQLQIWSLLTFTHDTTVPLAGPVGALCMGSASAGPLLVEPPTLNQSPHGGATLGFVDASTGKPLRYTVSYGQVVPPYGSPSGQHVRASANGTVFACPSGSRGSTSLVLRPDGVRAYRNEDANTVVAPPGPDGQHIYTATGIFSGELNLRHRPQGAPFYFGSPFLPAVEGPLFLRLVEHISRSVSNPGLGGREGGMDLEFYVAGKTSPFAVWRDFDGVPGAPVPHTPHQTGLMTDKRYLLVPSAQVLITIPASNDRLLLHRFDPDALLAKSGQDYLVFASAPPPAAGKGAAFRYKPAVKSARGSVQLRLDSGPAGMALTADGTLSWDVPAAFAERDAEVILSAGDAAEQVLQTFRLAVVDKGVMPRDVPADHAPAGPAAVQLPGAEKPAAVPKPAARPVPAAFTPFMPKEEKENVPLAVPAEDVEVGGGGRYLILHQPKARKLVIFDVAQGKFTGELRLAEDVIRYAAGATRLVVFYPNAKVLHVWNLATLEREKSADFPRSLTGDDFNQVCMGAATEGPVFIQLPREKRTVAVHLPDLNTTDVRWKYWSLGNVAGPAQMRVAADGSVLVGWGGSRAGLETATFRGGVQTGGIDDLEFSSGPFALPSADGRLLFIPWAIVTRDKTYARMAEWVNTYLLPAHESGFFLSLQGVGPLPEALHDPPRFTPTDLVVYSEGRDRLFSVSGLEDLRPGDNKMPWEKRIHYYPTGGLLVTLATSRDRLILRRVDLAERLEKSRTGYLFVASRPPTAKAGADFAYRLDIRSKHGGVNVKLEAGPAGLTVTPDGGVTWAVPENFGEPEVEVQVHLGDASGREVYHTFRITVAGG